MPSPISATRADFIAYMGQALEAQGLSPIAGRILGLLVFDGEARSFSDLATELGVSRGSISVNARHLVARGAILRENRPGDRQDYFRIADQSFDAMLSALSARMRETATAVRGFAAALPGGAEAQRRLCGLAEFYGAMAAGVDEALRALSDRS
ncbi:MAG: MarR family transcriptional regulator [Rhodobacteraceae bacterium]|nr:MarR family transcriptional regulator [Paracoccaceae bacterium]